MRKRIYIICIAPIFLWILFSTGVFAQGIKDTSVASVKNLQFIRNYQNGIVPQSIVYDEKNELFALINQSENAIDIVSYTQNDSLVFQKRLIIDNLYKRHDISKIYRPKSLAIYEDHILYLSSNSDSSRIVVVDFLGDLKTEIAISQKAEGIAINPITKEAYISSSSVNGYSISVIDLSKGLLSLKAASVKHIKYSKPKAAEEFIKYDPWGIGMAVTAMSIVFFALLLLYLIFKNIGRLYIRKARKQALIKEGKPEEASALDQEISGEVFAAISAAIHVYSRDIHDKENTVLTIKRVSKTYSPWSSKIYGLNSIKR